MGAGTHRYQREMKISANLSPEPSKETEFSKGCSCGVRFRVSFHGDII